MLYNDASVLVSPEVTKVQLRQGSDSKSECADLEVCIGIKHAAQVIESMENQDCCQGGLLGTDENWNPAIGNQYITKL